MSDGDLTADQLVDYYVQLRDKKDAITKAAQLEVDPINQAMARIEAMLLQKLTELGADSIKTPHGTPYKTVATSVSVADWDAFYPWAVANGQEGMLTRGANKAAVVAFLEAYQAPPPGLNISRAVVLNVSRK